VARSSRRRLGAACLPAGCFCVVRQRMAPVASGWARRGFCSGPPRGHRCSRATFESSRAESVHRVSDTESPHQESLKYQSQEPTSEQAHFPAEQPSPRQDPRVSPAHAHAGRSCDPRRSPHQGPRPALGLSVVLPATARLRQRADFTATVRRGRRGRSGLLAVHLDRASTSLPAPPTPGRVGFVVSRTVGPAVVRNRVLRRLRHLMVVRLDRLPAGSRVVVRAFAPAAAASSAALASALDRALGQALRESQSGTMMAGGQVMGR
jgi:ribonuclease P protein component